MSAEMIPVKGCDSVRMNTGNAKLVKVLIRGWPIRRNGPFQEQIGQNLGPIPITVSSLVNELIKEA